MLKLVFIAAFLFHATTSGLHQLQESWLDDIDGPKFLRGAKEEIQENSEELDTINDLPNDFERVARDDVITATSIVCDVATHPQGTKTTTWDKNKPVPLATIYACAKPYPTMVELDWPDDRVPRLTSRVLLHRCVGECIGTHEIQNCTVVEQEEVMLQVYESTTLKNVTVYNHTKCGCACRTRKSDCNEKFHSYSVDTCTCDCIKTASCNTSKHWFNNNTCLCECKSASRHCDKHNTNMEWNKDSCECDCKKKIKDRCIRKGKILKKPACTCECPTPLPQCPYGTSFLKYNCTCVDTSVSTK